VYGAISGTGAAVGLIAGGALTEFLSWRWTLLINTPIAIAVAVASMPLIKDSRVPGPRHYDVTGAITASAGLASLVWGFTEASTHSWTAARTLLLIAVGVVLLAIFVIRERSASSPLLPLRIVLDRNRGGSYLAFLFATMVMFSVFLFLTYYFQNVLGYSALKAGVAFLPFPVGVIVSSTIASRTMPVLGPRVLATAGFIAGTLGVLWLTQLSPDASYALHVVPSELLISLGMGHVFVSLSSTALLGVPNEDAGVASALVNTMQQVGGSVGIALMNTIATTATANYITSHGQSSPDAVVHGFTTAFTVGAAIMAAAAVMVFLLIRPQRAADTIPVQADAVEDTPAIAVV